MKALHAHVYTVCKCTYTNMHNTEKYPELYNLKPLIDSLTESPEKFFNEKKLSTFPRCISDTPFRIMNG